MGEAPAIQFYIKDWLTDCELQSASSATRGIWINALCFMWKSKIRGKISGSMDNLTRMLNATPVEFMTFLQEVQVFKFADVTVCNNDVTLINRRMIRDEIEKENTRLRVAKHRERQQSKDDVTEKYGDCNTIVQRSPSPSPSPEDINTGVVTPVVPEDQVPPKTDSIPPIIFSA